jgi:hypothetical protein
MLQSRLSVTILENSRIDFQCSLKPGCFLVFAANRLCSDLSAETDVVLARGRCQNVHREG